MQDRVDFCPGCRQVQPPEKWMGVTADLSDPYAVAMCADCSGPDGPMAPEPRDPLLTLTPRERTILKRLMDGDTVFEIAKDIGVSRQAIGALVRGATKPAFRRIYQRLLEANGIDSTTLARKTAELLESKRWQYNPEAKGFEDFPDNHAQLGALRHAQKTLDLDPPPEKPQGAAPLQIAIITNLFDGKQEDPRGVFVVKSGEEE